MKGNIELGRLLDMLFGIGIGLLLSAVFVGIATWAVTLGLVLVVLSLILRLIFKK